MSMNSPHESVKDIVKGIWKGNRPLAIAGLLVLVVVGYVLYKKSQAANATPMPIAGPSPAGTPGNTIYNTYSTITKTVTGQPPPVVAPPPTPGPQPGPGPKPPPPAGTPGVNFGLIPFSFFPTGRFPTIPGSNTTNVSTLSYQGVLYQIRPAGQGKVYGVDPAGRTWLLYEPASFYPGGPNYGK